MDSITDEWLKDYDLIEEFANKLMHKINQRNQYPVNTQAFAKSDLYIKDLFKKFHRNVGQLQETLNQLATLNKLTHREKERRQRLVDCLNHRYQTIENLMRNPVENKRHALLNLNDEDNSIVGWGEGLSNDISQPGFSQNVRDLKEIRQNMLKEQDKSIDTLSTIIIKQKSLAQHIDSELNQHNEILEDINDAMNDNNEQLIRTTRNIRYIDRQSNTCGYWLVIILLFIAILVVSLVPIPK